MPGSGNTQLGTAAVPVSFCDFQVSVRKLDNTCRRDVVPAADITQNLCIVANGIQINIQNRVMTMVHGFHRLSKNKK